MDRDATDLELAQLIAAGGAAGSEAEASLCRRYAPRVELYGKKHLKTLAAAEDLTQQVMLRVLEAVRGGRVLEQAHLSSFIFGTCRHVSSEMRRRDLRQRKIERQAELLGHDTAAPGVSGADLARLMRCMSLLPERDATVLRMSFMEERESDEIASRLGVSAGNIRVIRFRALAKVAGCMEPELCR